MPYSPRAIKRDEKWQEFIKDNLRVGFDEFLPQWTYMAKPEIQFI
jgi:hypothetical protein